MSAKNNITMKQARKYAEKTQEECAKILGVCRTTYIRLEENPSRLTIEQGKIFAQYGGLPVVCISFAYKLNLKLIEPSKGTSRKGK